MSSHPRSRHVGRYDLQKLVKAEPSLSRYVGKIPGSGEESLDFADPEAVKALNRALLKQYYGIAYWEIPPGYLCPAIPGRADYVHHAADLLSEANGGVVPRGRSIQVLDVGVGANLIYPIIGHREYGWRFVGSDVDPVALAGAKLISQSNGALKNAIELRWQEDPERIFGGIWNERECFELTVCNPPFHASLAEAREGAERKWNNLGKESGAGGPVLNFGGQGAELWCPGGEAALIRRMVQESAAVRDQCFWFTTLVSKESNLKTVQAALKATQARETRVIDLVLGQKKSRIAAWTYLTERQQAAWRRDRWAGLPSRVD